MKNRVVPSCTSLETTTIGVNLARRLSAMAARMPNVPAVVVPRRPRGTNPQYTTYTFGQLEDETNRLAGGLRALGVRPNTRMVLLVRPGIEFVALIYALFKVGAVIVLIDPGIGRRNLVSCLADAEPEGFIAVPIVHAFRTLLRRRFSQARYNVTVGRRLCWDGITLDQLRSLGSTAPSCHETRADHPAAIIFTSGSTGPAKGVLYCHGNFDQQATAIADHFAIRARDVDLCGFPLFALFNCALGVTTVFPDMDFSRPAQVDPRSIVDAIQEWHVTQSFGSPAMWHRVGQYCQERGIRLRTLRRVISAGAPVPPDMLARMKDCIAVDGEVYTPYGSTEALLVSSITASEVLGDTQHRWAQGGGTCVGRSFPCLESKVIEITDRPISSLRDAVELPANQIGELIVFGPMVTREYVTRRESNAMAKVADGLRVWHRMGDAVYVDDVGRFWFCGRIAHCVRTPHGTMFTVPCEAIFDQHPSIYRSALVGVGDPPYQRPVIVVQPLPGKMPRSKHARRTLVTELVDMARAHPRTESIRDFLVQRSLPVDARHNAKILRGKLAVWAARQLRVDRNANTSNWWKRLLGPMHR